MRYYDLFEAPLADFSFFGSKDKAGSLRDDDIRAANNPKWLIKLEKTFRFIEADVNVVLMNAPESVMTQHGNDYTATEVVPIGLGTISDWAGCYSPDDFKKHFGILPQQYKDRINIIIMNNEGGERLPLTAWMVAHRFMHSLANSQRRFYRNNTDVFFSFANFFTNMQQAMAILRKAVSVDVPDSDLYPRVATFASARNGKIARGGEFYIELATQKFLKGNFDFDISSFRQTLTSDDRYEIADLVSSAHKNLDACFKFAIGELFVF